MAVTSLLFADSPLSSLDGSTLSGLAALRRSSGALSNGPSPLRAASGLGSGHVSRRNTREEFLAQELAQGIEEGGGGLQPVPESTNMNTAVLRLQSPTTDRATIDMPGSVVQGASQLQVSGHSPVANASVAGDRNEAALARQGSSGSDNVLLEESSSETLLTAPTQADAVVANLATDAELKRQSEPQVWIDLDFGPDLGADDFVDLSPPQSVSSTGASLPTMPGTQNQGNLQPHAPSSSPESTASASDAGTWEEANTAPNVVDVPIMFLFKGAQPGVGVSDDNLAGLGAPPIFGVHGAPFGMRPAPLRRSFPPCTITVLETSDDEGSVASKASSQAAPSLSEASGPRAPELNQEGRQPVQKTEQQEAPQAVAPIPPHAAEIQAAGSSAPSSSAHPSSAPAQTTASGSAEAQEELLMPVSATTHALEGDIASEGLQRLQEASTCPLVSLGEEPSLQDMAPQAALELGAGAGGASKPCVGDEGYATSVARMSRQSSQDDPGPHQTESTAQPVAPPVSEAHVGSEPDVSDSVVVAHHALKNALAALSAAMPANEGRNEDAASNAAQTAALQQQLVRLIHEVESMAARTPSKRQKLAESLAAAAAVAAIEQVAALATQVSGEVPCATLAGSTVNQSSATTTAPDHQPPVPSAHPLDAPQQPFDSQSSMMSVFATNGSTTITPEGQHPLFPLSTAGSGLSSQQSSGSKRTPRRALFTDTDEEVRLAHHQAEAHHLSLHQQLQHPHPHPPFSTHLHAEAAGTYPGAFSATSAFASMPMSTRMAEPFAAAVHPVQAVFAAMASASAEGSDRVLQGGAVKEIAVVEQADTAVRLSRLRSAENILVAVPGLSFDGSHSQHAASASHLVTFGSLAAAGAVPTGIASGHLLSSHSLEHMTAESLLVEVSAAAPGINMLQPLGPEVEGDIVAAVMVPDISEASVPGPAIPTHPTAKSHSLPAGTAAVPIVKTASIAASAFAVANIVAETADAGRQDAAPFAAQRQSVALSSPFAQPTVSPGPSSVTPSIIATTAPAQLAQSALPVSLYPPAPRAALSFNSDAAARPGSIVGAAASTVAPEPAQTGIKTGVTDVQIPIEGQGARVQVQGDQPMLSTPSGAAGGDDDVLVRLLKSKIGACMSQLKELQHSLQ